MVNWENYKWPIITICVIFGVLMLMLTFGFTLGILSEDPDGLEATIINVKGEEWLEGLTSPWEPIFGWIDNDYIAGTLGMLIAVGLMMSIFFIISYVKKHQKDQKKKE